MRDHDRADFEQFAASQGKPLLRTAYFLTGDWDTAQDVVQTTMLNLCARWGRINADVDRPAYARRTLINAFNDQGRRRQRESRAKTAAADEESVRPVDIAERAYQRELLLRLPPRQRAVVVLRFLEDLSVAQTADSLGVSTGTVKSQTADALDALRKAVAAMENSHE